jgi:hypothetical protein
MCILVDVSHLIFIFSYFEEIFIVFLTNCSHFVFCQTCVAEGLAIRGGVLAGVKTGKLKDLLWMDALPFALGVLVWTDAGTCLSLRRFRFGYFSCINSYF